MNYKEFELTPTFKQNRFKGYVEKFRVEKKKINPVHELVNLFYTMKMIDKMPKEFYKGRYSYGKMAFEAKMLLDMCKGNLEHAMWCMDKMRYIAEKKRFDWSISTCLKYDLIAN